MKTSVSTTILLSSLLLGLMLVTLPTAAKKLPGEIDTLVDLRKSEFFNVSISPSGKYVSVIIRRDDRNTLVVLDRKTMQPIDKKSVEFKKKKFKEVSYSWWIKGDILAYGVREESVKYAPGQSGDIFLLHMNKPVNERLGWYNVISYLPEDKDNVLISVTPWVRQDEGVRPQVKKMKLSTGSMRNVAIGPGRAAQIMSNINGTVLGAAVPTSNLKQDYYYYDNRLDEPKWELMLPNRAEHFMPLSITKDGSSAYGLAQLEKGINAPQILIKITLETSVIEPVFDFGFASNIVVEFDREDGHPEYASWVDDEPRVKVFKNTQTAKVMAGFAKGFPGYSVSVTGYDDARENITLWVGSPGIRGEYYIWEKETGSARYLFSQQEKVDTFGLNTFQSVKYPTSDGVILQGWLLMPRDGKPKGLVNHIHGGPHGPYNEFGFFTEMQVMSEMGYAVFAPNFRGSGGYGNNLERAGYQKWGTRMLDDMREGAEFVQKNYDVGDKVYTMGGSYGGYASAQNMVRHNDYYDCSVIIAGVFDMERQIDTWDARRSYNIDDYTDTSMGSDSALLRASSPIRNLDKIKAPLLIIHGKADRRTPFSGAKKFVAALKKTDIDYTHYFYANEGHGLYFDDNSLDQYKQIHSFLNQCDSRTSLNIASR